MEKTDRVFLYNDEFKKLIELYDQNTLPESFNYTLLAFLFSCFTGLRHSDVLRIKYKDIKNNTIDITLKKKTSNGYKRLIVPLSKKAKYILSTIESNNIPDSLIFPNLISSSKCSLHLKAIAAIAEIPKNISFHVASHIFATISLGLGIELKNVSELLGHDSIRTTEVYAHLVEEHLKAAVDKWDKF